MENEKFIFVSYSHKNSPEVLKIINDLKNFGYNVWHDEGIEVGTEWTINISKMLRASSVVLAMITPESVNSVNCRNEINLALSLRKPFCTVYLTETDLTDTGLDLQLGTPQALFKYRHHSYESFIRELICSQILLNLLTEEEQLQICKALNYNQKKNISLVENLINLFKESGSSFTRKTDEEKIVDAFSKYSKVEIIDKIDSPSFVSYVVKSDVGIYSSLKSSIEEELKLEFEDYAFIEEGNDNKICRVLVKKEQRNLVNIKELLNKEEFTKSKLSYPLGISMDNEVIFDELTHHLLIHAENQNNIRSSLTTIVTSLIKKHTLDELSLMIFDKDARAFSFLDGCKYLYEDKIHSDMLAIAENIKYLETILNQRREQILGLGKKIYTIDLYNAVSETKLPRLLVIFNNFEEYAPFIKGTLEDILNMLLLHGPALGIQVIIATEKLTPELLPSFALARITKRIVYKSTDTINLFILPIKVGKLLDDYDIYFSSGLTNQEIRLSTPYINEEFIEEFKKTLPFLDEYQQKALEILQEEGAISTSVLQRKMMIGFNRARHIIDQLQEKGYIEEDVTNIAKYILKK